MPTTFSAEQNVVGPFDFRHEASLQSNGAGQRGGRDDRELRGGLRAQIGPQQNGEPKSLARRRHPFATEPAPAFRLRFGEDDHAFLHAVAREFIHHVVGRSCFLKHADVAAHDLGLVEPREQIVRVQQVGRADQPVALMRAGLDLIAERAQVIDARPDGGAAHAELLRKLRARHRTASSAAHGQENLCINGHVVSRFKI